MNQITLLVLLIVTSLFLPASAVMYANGSPQNSDESDSGSTDDASDDGSMDDESDTWSMEKSNNALASGSMDDESDDGSMDDESDTWSMEKSNNALTPEPTGGTNDGLSPLTSGPAGGTNDGLSPLTSGPTGTTNGLSPLTSGPAGGTNDGLSPLTSGFRIEGNNTGSAPASTAYNATFTRVPENKKNTNNETAANFANNILAVQNQERAKVGVPPLV